MKKDVVIVPDLPFNYTIIENVIFINAEYAKGLLARK